MRCLDCRQAHHDHRFRFAERGWIVELEIDLVFFRQGQSRNVLVFGGVKILHDVGDIHESADVGTVSAAAPDLGAADHADQIHVGSGG